MDIKERAKQELISYLVQTILGLIGSGLLIQVVLPDLTGLVQKLEYLPAAWLSKALLISSGLSILSVAYIIHLHSKNKFVHSGSLLWRKRDPVPFCPKCKAVDKTTIHMTFQKIKPGPNYVANYRYICPNCHYETPYSGHPYEKKDQ